MTAFRGTQNKATVREHWDVPIIRSRSVLLGRPLSYFGLPGPHMEDLVAWKRYLGRCTAIERLREGNEHHEEDLNAQSQLLNKAVVNGFVGFQLLRGKLEDVLIYGTDVDRYMPAISRLSPSGSPVDALFFYDLVNLDFLGGIGSRDKSGESKRVRAVKELLRRQRRADFLLLLTINVRDKLDDELVRYLTGTQKETAEALREILTWYASCGKGMKEYKLKAAVPLFIRQESQSSGFDCRCFPPIAYVGTGGARMVHFIFDLRHTDSVLPSISTQSAAQVVNLPLLEASDGQIRVHATQHPGFDIGACASYLDFLPLDIRAPILAGAPDLAGVTGDRDE